MKKKQNSSPTDKIDPICGMKGTIPAHGHYFCSTHCIKKYEEQHNLSSIESCPACTIPAKKWYKERLYIILIILLITLIITLHLQSTLQYMTQILTPLHILF